MAIRVRLSIFCPVCHPERGEGSAPPLSSERSEETSLITPKAAEKRG